MQVDYINFNESGDRQRYLLKTFGDLLTGRLLDVGCSTRMLEDELDGVDYTGIDVAGNPDIVVDLEAVERLPFEDRSFDCVVCNDVLEHIDTLHRIFDEVVRVSDRHVVISLPNCWRTLRRRMSRGRGKPQYYGLPAERPSDRHKWFFNVDDVLSFMEEKARTGPVSIVDTRVNVKPRPWPVRLAQRLRTPALNRYLNRHAHSVWTVLRRD
ncbi:MAG: class I SAM-dependent methyltransferase [Planctomycetes bacterium]|nr:class I SAM-dependent methyltransferase [Planctomycetota bacterium]